MTDDISQSVCVSNKNYCIQNYSHDVAFYCQRNKRCHWGWLFYIVSEFLPATSGAGNGFIFYVQVFDNLLVHGRGLIPFEETQHSFLKILFFIVHIFNLQFFFFKDLSFCLIESATALDMICHFTFLHSSPPCHHYCFNKSVLHQVKCVFWT